MENNNIFAKIEYPPCGFILQKDVYTTNLLYANDQFPLTSLKKRLPFRHKSGRKIPNPSQSVIIRREKGYAREDQENKNIFFASSSNSIFRHKLLGTRKLKFPLPKIKIFPLTNLNLHEEISKKDVKIKNMDDDLNISSNNGRKIFYRFKENKLSSIKKSNFPSIVNNKNQNRLINIRINMKFRHRKKDSCNKSRDKNALKNIVNQLNKELKLIKQNEIERKRSFIRDKFFSTQIYVENILDLNNNTKNNNNNNSENNKNNESNEKNKNNFSNINSPV